MKWLMQSSLACSEFLTLSLCHSPGRIVFIALHCATKTDIPHCTTNAMVRCPWDVHTFWLGQNITRFHETWTFIRVFKQIAIGFWCRWMQSTSFAVCVLKTHCNGGRLYTMNPRLLDIMTHGQRLGWKSRSFRCLLYSLARSCEARKPNNRTWGIL
jgi:hypothetical protein